MTIEQISDRLPEYAKDLKLNLSNVLGQVELTKNQIWGSAVASAMATGNSDLLSAIVEAAAKEVEPAVVNGAKAAAAIMGMNNVYYRFQHLTSNEKYKTMPARLRMNVIRTHGTDPVDFELYCIAVSALNACATCVDSHERVVREKGVPEETILAVVRIASVVHAVSAVLTAESALTTTAVPVIA